MFVYNGYQSADAVAVMFEHGGNPSLKIEDVSLIRNLNWELLFFLYNEDYRYFSDSVVHYWMVFIGYGAKLEQGEESIDSVGDFDIANLRNHRQYYYGVIHSDRLNDGIPTRRKTFTTIFSCLSKTRTKLFVVRLLEFFVYAANADLDVISLVVKCDLNGNLHHLRRSGNREPALLFDLKYLRGVRDVGFS